MITRRASLAAKIPCLLFVCFAGCTPAEPYPPNRKNTLPLNA